jgi:hypothetical protein
MATDVRNSVGRELRPADNGTVSQPLDKNFFLTKSANAAAKIIADLKAAAMSNGNNIVPEELLQLALLATAAVDEVNEERPWVFYRVSPRVEFWPVLFNERVKLDRFKTLRIGHELLNSRNPKKRGRDQLWAFFAKEIVASLEACRMRACLSCLPPSEKLEAMATRLLRKNQQKNLAELHPDFRTDNLPRYQSEIAAFRPPWLETLVTLEDFGEATCKKDPTGKRKDWVTEGKRFFKGVFRQPERLPEFRGLLEKSPDSDSEKRRTIIGGIGRAIAGLANQVEADL